MSDILPGILEREWDKIEERIERVKPFARAIHIDLLDGKFAPNTTFPDPKPFRKYSQDIFFELHMMVEDPIVYLEPWAEAGVKRFIGHVEQMPDQVEFVARGQLLGEVGLALDAKTPLSTITVPFSDLDTVLVMTVNAGFSNQSFLPDCLDKVRELAKQTDRRIEVDGGINAETMKTAYTAGARRFVSTGFLFSGIPSEQFITLSQLLTELAR